MVKCFIKNFYPQKTRNCLKKMIVYNLYEIVRETYMYVF